MNQLSELLSDLQRDAAVLPTAKLKVKVRIGLDALAFHIGTLQSIEPGAENQEEVIDVTSDVLTAALITAIYVEELTKRPLPRFQQVRFSIN